MKEALKLALEAIKNSHEYRIGNPAYEQVEAKIEEALAQPEQEPVAWMGTDIEGNPNKFRLNQFSGSFPLYAQPQPWTDDLALIAYLDGVKVGKKTTPPQRTWVGLTNEEIEQGCKESWVTLQAWQSGVWWAEAKLKEKNT